MLLCALALFGTTASAQLCSGVKGPNLLGAKGTFSAPYIKPNTNAATCISDGAHTYSPMNNIGAALTPCSEVSGSLIPCSDYNYVSNRNGMKDEFTYSILKTIGDKNGTNCIHPLNLWRGKDHTGDGGYFLAVNGAPSTSKSPIFYQIRNIPVCIGTTYEFSAWVLSLVPGKEGTTDNYSPNISFKVNGKVIANSGKIKYNEEGRWTQVGGQFTATTSSVDLEVINATAVGSGNDLGLDDISIRVCQSQIEVDAPQFVTEGSSPVPTYTVTDELMQNTWYKWQLSTDGGITFTDETSGDVAVFDPATKTYSVSPANLIGEVYPQMNGFMYQLVVSTSKEGLMTPQCIYVNSYHLIVVEDGTLPVELTTFTGSVTNGTAHLKWSTAQEMNSDRFELYRSFDGIDFSLAGTINAAGNSAITKNYSYADALQKASGYVYYKLKQIDKDGKFSFSQVLKLEVNSTISGGLQIFPNPVVNDFTATFNAPDATKANIIVRNASGQTIYNKAVDVVKGSNSVVVDNAPLSRGMYYISITGENINYNGRLQKQ